MFLAPGFLPDRARELATRHAIGASHGRLSRQLLSETMMVALANPFDSEGKQAVQQLLDYNVQWHLASPAAILKVMNDVYRL